MFDGFSLALVLDEAPAKGGGAVFVVGEGGADKWGAKIPQKEPSGVYKYTGSYTLGAC